VNIVLKHKLTLRLKNGVYLYSHKV